MGWRAAWGWGGLGTPAAARTGEEVVCTRGLLAATLRGEQGEWESQVGAWTTPGTARRIPDPGQVEAARPRAGDKFSVEDARPSHRCQRHPPSRPSA